MSSGYGEDIWCGDELVTSRRSRGVNTVLLAWYRRLRTPRGTLRGGDEESAYGLDLSSYVGAVGYPAAILAMPTLVRAELSKDDRAVDIAVTATSSVDAAGLVYIELRIIGTLVETGEDLSLTLNVSDVNTSILGGIGS
jgi:hypothetical protein